MIPGKFFIQGGIDMDFTGKTAVATGAASGMGLLFSQCFARLGGNVVMCDVNEGVLAEKVRQIKEGPGGDAVGVLCDVRDYAQVCGARDRAVETFGRIDVMANFAGGTAVRMLDVDPALEFPDIPIDVYDWGIDVNLKGQFYFAHAVMKQMREQKSGLIINIGSITGMEGDGRGVVHAHLRRCPVHDGGAAQRARIRRARHGGQARLRLPAGAESAKEIAWGVRS